MATQRRTGIPKTSAYTGQQLPYTPATTQRSDALKAVRDPSVNLGAGFVMDVDDSSVSMDPFRIYLPSVIPGWLANEVPLCIHIHNPDGALMIGTNKGHIYESVDEGLSWVLTLDTGDVAMKITSIGSSGYALASTDKGSGSYGKLYERASGSQSWTLRYTSTEPAINVVHYMGNWSMWVLITGGGSAANIYTSSDRYTWTARRATTAPEGSGFCDCITHVVAFCGGDSGTPRAYYTSNGTTWSIGSALPASPYPYTTAASVAWQNPSTGIWYVFVSCGAGGIVMLSDLAASVVASVPVYADPTRGGPCSMVNYRGRVYVFLNGSGVSVPHSMLKLYCYNTDTSVNAGFVQELEDLDWSVGNSYQPQNRYYPNFSKRYLIPVASLNQPYVYVIGRKNLIFL